jgi:hypothetical protein
MKDTICRRDDLAELRAERRDPAGKIEILSFARGLVKKERPRIAARTERVDRW